MDIDIPSLAVSIAGSLLSGGLVAAIITYHLNKKNDKFRDKLEADRRVFYRIEELLDEEALDILNNGDYYAGVYYPAQKKLRRAMEALDTSASIKFHDKKTNDLAEEVRGSLEKLLSEVALLTTKESGELITTKSRGIDFNNAETMKRVKEESDSLLLLQEKAYEACTLFLSQAKERLRA